MKFFTLLALPALFIGTFAAPAAVPETAVAVEKRQIGDAYSIVEGLLSDVKQYTGAINTTAASIDSSSTASEKSTAAKSYRKNIKAITSAVKSATSQVSGLSAAALSRRQTGDALAALVSELLEEISGALNNIIATLGLGALLGSLNPLVSSLSALLLSLEVVVDNLLALVKQIVDGLLTGLSIGLAGLNL